MYMVTVQASGFLSHFNKCSCGNFFLTHLWAKWWLPATVPRMEIAGDPTSVICNDIIVYSHTSSKNLQCNIVDSIFMWPYLVC